MDQQGRNNVDGRRLPGASRIPDDNADSDEEGEKERSEKDQRKVGEEERKQSHRRNRKRHRSSKAQSLDRNITNNRNNISQVNTYETAWNTERDHRQVRQTQQQEPQRHDVPRGIELHPKQDFAEQISEQLLELERTFQEARKQSREFESAQRPLDQIGIHSAANRQPPQHIPTERALQPYKTGYDADDDDSPDEAVQKLPLSALESEDPLSSSGPKRSRSES